MHRACEWPDTEILSPLHLSIQRGLRPSSTRICLSFLCVLCGQHSLSNPYSQARSVSLPPTLSQAQSTSLSPPLPSTSKSIDQTTTTVSKQVSSNHKNLLYIPPKEARSFIFPDPLKLLPVQLRLKVRFQHPLIHPGRPSWRARLTTDGRKFPILMLLSFYSKDTKITERDCPGSGTPSQKDPAALNSEARVEWWKVFNDFIMDVGR